MNLDDTLQAVQKEINRHKSETETFRILGDQAIEKLHHMEGLMGDIGFGGIKDLELAAKEAREKKAKGIEVFHTTCEVQEFTLETPFAKAVRKEIARARDELKYPPMNSVHEGYAVIKEELEEFWQECKRKPTAREKQKMHDELVQIAAMAQRTAEDLKLGGKS